MQRTAVNPWDWSLKLGYNQAELITGATRQLICAGQTAVDAQGHASFAIDAKGGQPTVTLPQCIRSK